MENKELKFNAALNLFKLASEQIYQKFSVMVIVHSIFISVIIFSLLDKNTVLALVLFSIGIALTVIWMLFNKIGIKTEKYYIEKCEEMIGEEGHFIKGQSGFGVLSNLTAVLFMLIYLIMFVLTIAL